MTHSEGLVTMKGFISSETRDLAKTPEDLAIQPVFSLSTTTGAPVHTFPVKAVAHSYWCVTSFPPMWGPNHSCLTCRGVMM